MDIWQLLDIFRNPMGGFAAPIAPGNEIPAVSMTEVKSRREAARAELERRGLDDEQIETLRQDGPEANEVIKEFLAANGSRYG